MKKHTLHQQTALDRLANPPAAPLTSWDFGAGTVSWLRKRGYVEPRKVAGSEGSKLVFTDAGREAQKRGAS
jgi:hypothetical protein